MYIGYSELIDETGSGEDPTEDPSVVVDTDDNDKLKDLFSVAPNYYYSWLAVAVLMFLVCCSFIGWTCCCVLWCKQLLHNRKLSKKMLKNIVIVLL